MGSILGGGSKQKSSSSNQSYGTISNAFSPLLGYASQGASGLSSLLSGDTSGLDAYNKATGLDSAIQAGSRGITGNAAAGGMLRSGATQKALANYATGQQNQNAQSYMSQLSNLAGLGLNAGQTIAGAGQTSQSSGKSKGGLGSFAGSLIGGIAASDRRLKEDINFLEEKDGIKWYTFRYKGQPTTYKGVMAQDIIKDKPEALGPIMNGYMTVDYNKIGEDYGIVS